MKIIRTRSRLWVLVLVVVLALLSVGTLAQQDEPETDADPAADVTEEEDADESTSTFTPSGYFEEEDDDGTFEVSDLLPGFENADESFFEKVITGGAEHYYKNYSAPHVVPNFNGVARFGHTKEFAMLLGKNPDDYFLGLFFFASLVVSVITFWSFAILILKCVGPNHVGFLSGFPFREEGRRSSWGRTVLSISCWTMIVATIVMITKGLTELQKLSDTLAVANLEIKTVEFDVGQIVTTLQVVSAKTAPIRDELVDFLKRDICPLEPGSDTEDQVRSVGEDTYDAMTDLEDFIAGYLEDVNDGVNQTAKFTNRVNGFLDMAQFTNNWKVTLAIFPYFILPSFILVAVCMGWFDVFSEGFYSFITWIVLPLLVVLTIFAVVCAAWLLIFLQANTDLCMPDPAYTLRDILDALELDSDGDDDAPKTENGPSDNFFYDIMIFYTHQCTMPNPWQFLEGHYADLDRGRNILEEFIRSIEDTTLFQLSQECGQEYGPILLLLLALRDLIRKLAHTSIKALNLMSCRNIVPIYQLAIQEAVCTLAPVSMTWVMSCAIVIAFCGMMIFTFRGAYYPIDYYYYDEKDLYPEDTDDEDYLMDNDCNDLILKQQEQSCQETMDIMEEEKRFDVYQDDEEKEYGWKRREQREKEQQQLIAAESFLSADLSFDDEDALLGQGSQIDATSTYDSSDEGYTSPNDSIVSDADDGEKTEATV